MNETSIRAILCEVEFEQIKYPRYLTLFVIF